MIYLLLALESEMPDSSLIPANFCICYTGVGKVNAAIASAKICQLNDCDQVINYGTAGTLLEDLVGHLVKVSRIYQRDMDARPIVELGITPFEDSGGVIDLGFEGVSLSTGDNFVTSPPDLVTDIVDMEGYAIAKACRNAGKYFTCYKYITDLADENASQNWSDNVAKGAKLFLEQKPWLSTR